MANVNLTIAIVGGGYSENFGDLPVEDGETLELDAIGNMLAGFLDGDVSYHHAENTATGEVITGDIIVTNDISIVLYYAATGFILNIVNGTTGNIVETYDVNSFTVQRKINEITENPPEIAGFKYVSFEKIIDDSTGNITIKLIYESLGYKITFIDSDGTVLKEEIVPPRNSATPPEVSVPEDYEFSGWQVSPADLDYTYVEGDITATATYTKTYFTVTFVDGDNNILKTDKVYKGNDAIPPEAPLKEGYRFSQWDNTYENITSDIIVTAIYKSNRTAWYTVKFLDYNGVTLKTQKVWIHDAAIAPELKPREAFIFVGWDKNFSDVVEDMTVTAIYKRRDDTFKVRFVDWDNSLIDEQSVVYGYAAAAPSVKERPGYDFAGWSRDFSYIVEETVVHARYFSEWSRDVIEVYNISPDGTSYYYCGSILMAMDCRITHNLNGECRISVKTLAKFTGIIQPDSLFRFKNLLFCITEIKKETQNGIYIVEASGEHISYLLNEDALSIDEFYFTGNPRECLARILLGTGFNVGLVDFEGKITLNVNRENTTRRQMLMQLVALCGGELEYVGTSIGIRKHIGSISPINLMGTLNVTDLTMNYNSTDNTTTYDVKLSRKTGVSLGDELHISFRQLAIDSYERICYLEWNPFNFREITIGVGDYIELYNEDLYTIQERLDDLEDDLANTKKKIKEKFPDDEELEDPDEPIEDEPGDNPSFEDTNLKVVSCKTLPVIVDPNTIYLIQGEMVMY